MSDWEPPPPAFQRTLGDWFQGFVGILLGAAFIIVPVEARIRDSSEDWMGVFLGVLIGAMILTASVRALGDKPREWRRIMSNRSRTREREAMRAEILEEMREAEAREVLEEMRAEETREILEEMRDEPRKRP